MKWIITIFLIACCAASDAQIYNTPHFKIFYSGRDDKKINEIADSLEGNYTRIVTDLQCQEPVNVKIHLYPDTLSYREGVKRWAPNLPSWSSGSTLGDSVIHMVSPNAPKRNYAEALKEVIHEFAHCVSRHGNWKIVNNPRWLWESIAIYESRQWYDPRKLTYLVDQKPPGLKQLNNFSDTTIYDIGYLLCEYLVETKGKSVLNALIKNNGNIKQTLDMDDDELIRQWFLFVKRKYEI